MKKSKYISKYDYIAYYTKPKEFWFFTNDEIVASLNALYQQYSAINNKIKFIDIDDEDIDEIDSESDFLEYYKIAKEESLNVDDENPQILGGLIIDKKTKEFVINEFSIDNKFNIIDFDEKQYVGKTMETLANITETNICNNENLIMFQPVFIYKNTITKPDAFVKIKDEIFIIETKGTSSSKRVYFLDLFFQKNVIESQQYLIDMNCTFKYKLCIVKYEKLKQHNISFVMSDYFNYQKSYSKSEYVKSSDSIELTALEKIGYPINKDPSIDEPPITFNKVLSGDFSELDERALMNRFRSKALLDVKEHLFYVVNEYDNVIQKLWNHKLSMKESDLISHVYPSPADKGYFKPFDYFPELKKIYSLMGFKRMEYSGNFSKQTGADLEIISKNETVKDFFKTSKSAIYDFSQMFQIENNFQINENETIQFWEKLKKKKVYFDFETLNPAIRVIDDSLPFAQIVTQCSIIKDKGLGASNSECNNLIIDPLKLNKEWYKIIIDSLYEGDDFSYVVYNQTFEKGRLNEMAIALNDSTYTKKVETIVKNIYDIADFFKLSNKTGYKLFFEELKGFYSIKKVLPLIEKHAPNIFNETNCKNYNDLEIYNGKICQDKTILRFFNGVNDSQWESLEKEMKIYCENDVRAMIAVEYFVRDILNNKIKFN